MTAPELTHVLPDVRRGSALPWGAIADLSGLAVATLVAATQLDVRRAGFFLVFLVGFGLVTWLVFRQLQPRLPGLIRPGYRYVFVPVVASVLTLTLAAMMRDYYSRGAIVGFALVWTLWIGAGRYVLRRYAPPLRVLCVGSGGIVRELARQPRLAVESLRSPTLEYRPADLVVVDEGVTEQRAWLRWLLHAEMSGVPLMSAHRARETLTGQVRLEALSEEWAEGAFRDQSTYLAWKRFFDITVVLAASPLILIVSATVALALLMGSGRPVLFTQRRIGRNGRPFRIYKFRTMRADSEARGPAFASQGDARVTRFGAVLRKYRLDELPQFWNVLLGDMSIIGPRPEQAHFVDEYAKRVPHYLLRHVVRPGITGWAQVAQGYTASVEETRTKLCHDLYYVKHCSAVLDMFVILKTIRVLASGFGSR